MDRAPDSIGPTVDVALLADAVQAVREALRPRWGWDTLGQVISGPPPEHGDRAPAPGPDLVEGRRPRSVGRVAGRRRGVASKPLSHQVRLPTQP